MQPKELEQLLNSITELAKKAGQAIFELYESQRDPLVQVKEDGSPLTLADKTSNDIIMAGLARLVPQLPILSEENADIPFAERASWEYYWLVDPLDGTKEFLHRTNEFTVNIALIENHHPILGVVYAPVLDECYWAGRGLGVYKQVKNQKKQVIHIKPWEGGVVQVITSRRHGNELLQNFTKLIGEYETQNSGSSLKFCKVAEGTADVYPRFGTTSEWDTAAGQCVLEEAGGAVVDDNGDPLTYNMRDSLQNPHFLAMGDKNMFGDLIRSWHK